MIFLNIIDYHVHSSFSGDCSYKMEDMILSAIEKNVQELVFTDHVDIDNPIPINEIDYDEYIPFFSSLKEKYSSKIDLRLGVEVGLQNHTSQKISDFLSKYDFDFIIGSSHAAENQDVCMGTFFEGRSLKESYLAYFKDMLNNTIIHKNFCVYGHLDYVKRYSPFNENELLYKDYADVLDEVLKNLISKGKGIEINTAGMRYGLGHFHPQVEFLTRYKELGGEIITIGSDSHRPQDIGSHFDSVIRLLDSLGFRYISKFRKKEPIMIKIK